MMIAFTLTMPSINTWNNRWSGEGQHYVRVRTFRKEPTGPNGEAIVGNRFGYDFGDGWYAAVTVERVDVSTGRKLRNKSDGFCGYDWMIDSILRRGEILVERRT